MATKLAEAGDKGEQVMDTFTNDERREVAERLRKLSAHGQSISCDAVDKALGIWYDDSYFGCVFAHESVLRLADLIDPTCHVVSEALHTGSFGCEEAGTEFTLSCGHTVIVDGDFPPGYCDECGARVVSDDE